MAAPTQDDTMKPESAHQQLQKEHIDRLTETAFRKLADYTRGELQVLSDDCQLLQTMNKTTKDKYSEMSRMSQRLVREISRVQNTYADFSMFIDQIDDIHQQAVEMEKVAKELDQYARHLEDKVQRRVKSTEP
ncbi:biogenesis of lysosome-related organelles complex-1 subunit 2-domain-containing protein [Gongronella butleri]|nr:biogenesis of lysosome-related organelles complex-1 subunit 2-domain-containing protein [Gongronella butleri]